MEIQEFIEHFADQLDETDLSELKPETVFRDLDEWSSLTALYLIAMVDEEYDVALKGDDVKRATTLADLFEIVKAKKA